MKPLTARQAATLEAIRTLVRANRRPPTIREVCTALDITSVNGLAGHLKALQRHGLIERQGRMSRGIRLVGACPVCGHET
jgi:repressor LexA